MTFSPIALSLALHAGAAMLAFSVTLPRQAPPVRHDLTIGLALLPTAPALSEPPQEAPAVSEAAPAALEADGASSSVKSIVPDEAPSAPPAAEARQKPPDTAAGAEMPEPAKAAVAPETAATAPTAEKDTQPGLAKAEIPAETTVGATPSAVSQDVSARTLAGADAEKADEALAPVVSEAPIDPVANLPTVEARPAGDAPAVSVEPGSAPPESVSDQARNDAPPAVEDRQALELQPPSAPTVMAEATAPPLPADAHPVMTAAPGSPALPGTSSTASEAVVPSLAPLPTQGQAATVVAALPASPIVPEAVRSQEVDDAPTPEMLRRAEQFIAGYDGGPCVFLSAVRAFKGRADVDAFAVEDEPFGIFDQGFTAAVGFDSKVLGQKIWKPQCPAIDFLRGIHGQRGAPPTIQLQNAMIDENGPLQGTRHEAAKNVTIRGRTPLRGTIHDPAHRPMHLFAVSETGTVQDISSLLVPAGEDFTFTFTAERSVAGGPRPQLLVAIAGEMSVVKAGAREAPAFFAALATEAARRPDAVAAAAKLFLLSD